MKLAEQIDVLADAQANFATDGQLRAVGVLAQKQVDLEAEIAALEETLKERKAEHWRVATEELPEAMDAASLSEIRTKDGALIKIKRPISASVPKDRWPEALAWLKKNGHDGLIKGLVAAEFPKGKKHVAEEAAAKLKELFGLEGAVTETVHHMTLSAWAREQINNGNKIPKDLFGVFDGRIAVIEKEKKNGR